MSVDNLTARFLDVPFVDLGVVNKPYAAELTVAFDRVFASSRFVDGDEVAEFEAMLAAFIGVRHAIGVNSGTSALQLALLAAEIGPGDEVILPANTFFATAEAVVGVGAIPRLVDCDPRTALVDLDAAEAAVDQHTAAIIPVHLHGQPVDMDRTIQIAEQNSLFLLEDNAQAIGATWRGRATGSFGDAAAFSFYPSKNLGALGEGGAVTTNDDAFAARVELLRAHGSRVKYEHEEWGWNERLHTLQAAFLVVKLARLQEAQQLRDAAVAKYRQLTSQHPLITWFEDREDARNVWHLAVVQVPHRDDVQQLLREVGVQTAVHYPVPIHLTGASNGELGAPGAFPVAERLANSTLSLPLFPGITDRQVEHVAISLMTAVDRVSS